MLEVGKSSSIDHSRALPAETGLSEQITAAIHVIRRQYLIFLLCALFGTMCGIIYLRSAHPVYTAQTEILIDRGKSSFVQQQSILADVPVDTIQLESQMQIMRSPNIALSVVNKLNLAEDPEFIDQGGSPIRSVVHFIAGFFPIAARSEPQKSEVELTQQAVGALLKNLEVNRVGVTYLIELGFRSNSPAMAARIANAVADAYITDQLDAKFETNRRASTWLRGRVEELRQQSSAAERMVNAYKESNAIVDAGGKPIGDQELAELNTQLVAARAKTSEALARFNRIEATLQADRPDAAVNATVSDALINPLITKFRQDYLDYVNKESEYSARYGKDHLAVVNIRNKIRDLRNSIISELKRMAETFKSDYLIAKEQQDAIEQQLASSVSKSQTANSAQVNLRELESAAQGSRSLYNLFQQRYLESTQQESFPVPEARVVSAATIPVQSSSKSPIVVLAMATLGGVMLGGCLGLLRDTMDGVFRTDEQVETTLRLPCVALVPLIKENRKKNRTSRDHAAATMPTGSRVITLDYSLAWTVLHSPFSRFAEAIRSVKLAADLTQARKTNIVIGLTSSVPNEGKSTISVALAQLIAQSGRRVIVVDCDLRNPSLSKMLAPEAEIGLIEVLSGENNLGDGIWTEPRTNMAFLPVVRDTRFVHASEIFASAATKTLVDQLRDSYDYVILDLPPIVPVVDARATTHLVDFYFLVIEWGRTKIGTVQHALKTANLIYDNLVGAILNKTDMGYMSRYGGHNKEYYKYYSRYGVTD
jgi:succinoglycan biosynthesis transport protein ExoP